MFKFPKAFAVACAIMAAGTAGVAQAATQLRMSTAAPDNSPLTDAFRQIKQKLDAAFPGALDISVHPASSLFRQGTELPAMQRGNLEMASPVTFEIEAQLPEYGVFSSGYVFRDPEHMLKVFNGPIGEEFYAKVADKMGLVILDTAYLGTRQVGLRDVKNIKTPKDFAGVKLRMPPGAAFQTLARAMGVTPLAMPITEVYLALQTGSIDGQDNPANMTRDWKFNEVTKEIVLTQHIVQPVFIAISKSAYDKLTPDQQKALRAAAKEATAIEVKKTVDDEKAAIEGFKKAGIVVSEPDLALFRANAARLYKEEGYEAKWQPGLKDKIEAIK
ncbi:DctP family TRAP transporter solute-binding subunit [Chelatococcus asaccharovorans]|uniref:Tripartite ATP-independent transporter DctP family solute receptor n=1 Tax=Chelatococcus asaccharovorans TaxID=28210 RepID=A0A2V3TSR3_9HYPH|nr:DctP family TRAP transporter solute-binding subunit [Chelatococcus asaccharovorans]MBS7704957.1 DctP family TRAP transporter solute-binding subunit [Chelatococcus asaccharovorans]PXW51871.1 tripartite ATP-independent transporter DctP family solute receptor [Chelatococcus asaccharovorans]CAH1651461.1 Tripartite ATP-independent transporter DctP family solute receptor [Chelatococcus asaccharovorans]CAH1686613.1 Tripartite ATP-independent transporter DctP family solute receptor [Chelatococcus as